MINYNLEKFKDLNINFLNNSFFPHIVIDNFLKTDFCDIVEKEISTSAQHAKPYYVYNVKKFGLTDYNSFGENTKKLIQFLNSQEFLLKLEALTGIKNLISDSSLEGGGLHFTKKDGYLKIHADFQSHIIKKTFARRLNLLLYFNRNWTENNKGNIEFWNKDLNEKVSYTPDFNRIVIFKTDEFSYHGHPEKLIPPDGILFRKSLALYYYTDEKKELALKETNFKSLKSDSYLSSLAMKIDQYMLRVFSYLKRKNILSDKFVTKILSLFVKNK